MENQKFKKGDIVIANDENFKNNVAKTAGRPVGREDLPIYTYFEKDIKYVVKNTGMYTDGCHVLVEGSTQFVHERYFDMSENETSIVSSTKWSKMHQIETFVGKMNDNSEMVGERKKLLVIHECGDDNEALVGQLETMIYGLKNGFESFGCN